MKTSQFLQLIDRSDRKGCWPWRGGRTSYGYGSVYLSESKSTDLAHRVSWMTHNNRRLRKQECVCHHCDNPICCNPRHLFVGDRAANNRDKTSKGRNVTIPRPGERNPMSKLKVVEVKKIRDEYQSGEVTYQSLADRHHVSVGLIGMIVRREVWQHI